MSGKQNNDAAILRVKAAISKIKERGMVIMTDDPDRENEGDLVCAAEWVTPEQINFMALEARGLICLSLAPPIVEKLELPMMYSRGGKASGLGTAFTVSIEAREGVSTGISAADRAHTIKVAVDEETTSEDIVVPGHVFPLKSRKGGVLERAGHTEGSVDLVRLAGSKSAAVICEIMNPDGSMARSQELQRFAKHFDLPIVSISDLIAFRLAHESLLREVRREKFTLYGTHTLDGVWFKSVLDDCVYFALVKGSQGFSSNITDVRVHKIDPLGDLFDQSSLDSLCYQNSRYKLDYFLKVLDASEQAVLLFFANSGELSFLESGQKQDVDTRLNGMGSQILRKLGVKDMRLHLSAPRNLTGLEGFGLNLVDSVTIPKPTSEENGDRHVEDSFASK